MRYTHPIPTSPSLLHVYIEGNLKTAFSSEPDLGMAVLSERFNTVHVIEEQELYQEYIIDISVFEVSGRSVGRERWIFPRT